MADVSTSKNQRGTYTKKDKEDMMPKTTFFSKLRRVGDTNIGKVDMTQLRDKLMDQATRIFQGNWDAYFTLLRYAIRMLDVLLY